MVWQPASGPRGQAALLWALAVAICLSGGCRSTPQSARAGQGSVRRDGRVLVLNSAGRYPYLRIGHVQMDYLARHGWVAGQNLHVEVRNADNTLSAAARLMETVDPADYDVICTVGTIATMAARDRLLGRTSTPVVFSSVTDPIGIGVIDGFEAAPAANFTGVSHPVPVASRFQFIRVMMPRARRIALIQTDLPQSQAYERWVRQLVASPGPFCDLQVQFRCVPWRPGVEGVVAMMNDVARHVRELDDQVDLFVSGNDPLADQPEFARTVAALASKPLCGMSRTDVMDGNGATFAIFPSYDSMGRQSGAMVRRLLEGQPVASIVPEAPRDNGIAIDMARARTFGLDVPVQIVEMAGENIVGAGPAANR